MCLAESGQGIFKQQNFIVCHLVFVVFNMECTLNRTKDVI